MDTRMLKYPLFDMGQVTDDSVTIEAPKAHSFQHLAMQGTWITLWAQAVENRPPHKRTFFVFGTGHVIPGDLVYVGTVHDRQFVWHVFEKREV